MSVPDIPKAKYESKGVDWKDELHMEEESGVMTLTGTYKYTDEAGAPQSRIVTVKFNKKSMAKKLVGVEEDALADEIEKIVGKIQPEAIINLTGYQIKTSIDNLGKEEAWKNVQVTELKGGKNSDWTAFKNDHPVQSQQIEKIMTLFNNRILGTKAEEEDKPVDDDVDVDANLEIGVENEVDEPSGVDKEWKKANDIEIKVKKVTEDRLQQLKNFFKREKEIKLPEYEASDAKGPKEEVEKVSGFFKKIWPFGKKSDEVELP